MKLSELYKPTEIKQFRDEMRSNNLKTYLNAPELINLLNDAMGRQGFTKIGSGTFAMVYGSAKYPYALKVFTRDSAYEKWYEFCKHRQDNKYVPKIKGRMVTVLRHPTNPQNSVFAARIEKLEPFDWKKCNEDSYRFVMGFNDQWKELSKLKNIDIDLAEVCYELLTTKEYLDLHYHNIMMRGDQVVVIDPYFA